MTESASTDLDERFMQVALTEAERCMQSGEMPIGAALVCEREVIARSGCDEKGQGLLGHAELLALQAAEMKGLDFRARRQATLYTTLEPCLMCMGAVMSAFVGRVVYSMKAPADGAVDLVQMFKPEGDSFKQYQAPEVVGGLLQPKSRELMEQYIAGCESPGRRQFALGLL
jgi:tRNA(adenine34) deaminase